MKEDLNNLLEKAVFTKAEIKAKPLPGWSGETGDGRFFLGAEFRNGKTLGEKVIFALGPIVTEPGFNLEFTVIESGGRENKYSFAAALKGEIEDLYCLPISGPAQSTSNLKKVKTRLT